MQRLSLNSTQFDTEDGGTAQVIPAARLHARARRWTIPIILDDAFQESALRLLFDGATVPMVLPDGTEATVCVLPAVIPKPEYPVSVVLDVAEVV